jgi:hypothetical protein
MRTDILFFEDQHKPPQPQEENVLLGGDDEPSKNESESQREREENKAISNATSIDPSNNNNDNNNHNNNKSLVSDLCHEIQDWSDQQDTAVLQEMGLYNMTLEAFLGPGITMLRAMLVDGGIAKDKVDRFLELAQLQLKILQQQQQQQ